jgi:endonuclease/exonuclease/phosphatase family metal-dependent hydrolase
MENNSLFNDFTLNLVTLNCLGVPFMNTRVRLDTIARELDQSFIDVLCLQEVQLSHYVPRLVRRFSTFPFAVFEPFIYSPKGGLLTFSQRPVKQSAFALYPERGWWHSPSLADHMLHKGILVTELTYAGQQVVVLNTHLTANYDGDWSPSNRYARLEQVQLRQLAGVIQTLPPEALVVVAGDFNLPRHSWLYEEFVEATGVIDPLSGQMKPTYYPFLALPVRYHQPIDYIFVRPAAGTALTIQANLLFEEPLPLTSGRFGRVSDHAAIQLCLQWRPENSLSLDFPQPVETLDYR